MSKIKRLLFIVTTFLLVVMAWGWFNIWRSPAYYTPERGCGDYELILTMSEYGHLMEQHARPYIVKTEDVVLFGAEHTRDSDNSQIALIQSEWQLYQPTVALIEGRLGFFIPYAMDPVSEYGESGLVASLAKGDGVELFSWELPRSDLIARLLETYSAEQVALSQILGPYFSNYRFGRPDDPDQFVTPFLNRAGYPGLDNVISSVADIDSIWARDFADFPDWRETSDQYGLPGYLAEIGATTNLIRNRHFLCVIDELRARGERVFAICGLSHAVCIEPELISQN